MQLYNCTVQLNGSMQNAVRKFDVTGAEIVLLRHIHGQSENAAAPVKEIDAFDWVEGPKDPETDEPTKIKSTKGVAKRTDAQERTRLASMYSHGDSSGSKLIAEVLGVAGVPLPKFAVDDAGVEIRPEASEITETAPAPRTRVRKEPTEAAAA